MEKVCLKCEKSKDVEEFHVIMGYRHSYCRECQKDFCKKYYADHKEKIMEQIKENQNKKYNGDIQFKIKKDLNTSVYNNWKKYFESGWDESVVKQSKTFPEIDMLGILRFLKSVCPDNYSPDTWWIKHFIEAREYDLTCEKQRQLFCCGSNLYFWRKK